jgi:hypothetical protein
MILSHTLLLAATDLAAPPWQPVAAVAAGGVVGLSLGLTGGGGGDLRGAATRVLDRR